MEILERKQEDIYTRCRGEITGVKQHGNNGCSPVYTSAKKINNSLHNSETFITKMKDRCEANIVRDRHNILMEKEDNQTVKSLQFCYLKKCIDENLEEYMKRVRVEAEKCEYLEQDRWIKEQFICGLDNEGMQTKIMNEIKAKSKTDNVTSEHVLMLLNQEEINMIQVTGAGQTNAKAGQTDAEMIRTGTCKYCGSSHPPRRCPAYGMMCGQCSRVNHFSAV